MLIRTYIHHVHTHSTKYKQNSEMGYREVIHFIMSSPSKWQVGSLLEHTNPFSAGLADLLITKSFLLLLLSSDGLSSNLADSLTTVFAQNSSILHRAVHDPIAF